MAISPKNLYPARVIDGDSDYPYGKALNLQNGVQGTGTPLEAEWVNDQWGFQQALLDDAGLVPSGQPDKVGDSQYLEALKGFSKPASSIVLDNNDTVQEYSEETTKFTTQSRQAIEAVYKAQGYNNVFFFEDGFTYTESNDVGIYEGGTAWTYADAGALPVTVAANTVPSEGVYKSVKVKASSVELNNGDSIQVFKDRLSLKSIKSLADSAESIVDGTQFVVTAYFEGGLHGGGRFTWQGSVDKSLHDGGTMIDPDKTFPSDWGDQTQFSDWFTPATSGAGVFVRSEQGFLTDLDFGSSDNDTSIDHNKQLNRIKDASCRLSQTVTLTSPEYRTSDTIIVDSPNCSVVGIMQANNKYTKISRFGTVDTWRSCFHVTSSSSNFDKLYLYAEGGFPERAGVTYGEESGKGNKLGHIQGAYWSLGITYPKDTGKEFELDIDKLNPMYGGRAYSSSNPNTPYGAINIKNIEGVYCGFVDISGGSVHIENLSIRNTRSRAIKKGNDAEGGKISVGNIKAFDGNYDCLINFTSSNESFEGIKEGVLFTGSTSGATGLSHALSRDYIALSSVSGAFEAGETITDGVNSAIADTVTNYGDYSVEDAGVVHNAGTHFESFEIGSLEVTNYPGDLLWILNSGLVNVGSIQASGVKGGRHLIRYTPILSAEYKSSLTVGSVDINGVFHGGESSWFPLYFTGDNKVSIGQLNMSDITSNIGSNFINSNSPTSINSLVIDTSGGAWSRFLNFSSDGVSAISNAVFRFDSATRLGTVSAGSLLISNCKFTNTGGFDGAGEVLTSNFTAL